MGCLERMKHVGPGYQEALTKYGIPHCSPSHMHGLQAGELLGKGRPGIRSKGRYRGQRQVQGSHKASWQVPGNPRQVQSKCQGRGRGKLQI